MREEKKRRETEIEWIMEGMNSFSNCNMLDKDFNIIKFKEF